jgi:steroid delta-isomerase-like uncharacterized protein
MIVSESNSSINETVNTKSGGSLLKELLMSVRENQRIAEEINEALEDHDIERILRLYDDDVLVYTTRSPEMMRGKEAIRENIESLFKGFPDFSSKVLDRIITDDQVVVEFENSGTNTGPVDTGPGRPVFPPTGKEATMRGVVLLKIKKGKIVEFHQYYDIAGLMMQLGLLAAEH